MTSNPRRYAWLKQIGKTYPALAVTWTPLSKCCETFLGQRSTLAGLPQRLRRPTRAYGEHSKRTARARAGTWCVSPISIKCRFGWRHIVQPETIFPRAESHRGGQLLATCWTYSTAENHCFFTCVTSCVGCNQTISSRSGAAEPQDRRGSMGGEALGLVVTMIALATGIRTIGSITARGLKCFPARLA